jgi:hypothetical protein
MPVGHEVDFELHKQPFFEIQFIEGVCWSEREKRFYKKSSLIFV